MTNFNNPCRIYVVSSTNVGVYNVILSTSDITLPHRKCLLQVIIMGQRVSDEFLPCEKDKPIYRQRD